MNDDLFGAPSKKGPRDESGRDEYSAKDIEVLEGLEPVRRRPGMYIGGTDEAALHHLAAEMLDNAMDEAVAGHADRIEMRLERGNFLTVRDNGRGIPVDPHPKFKHLSALEVILTTLHSGGKFGGKAYDTSGGLHGVGASVVNALSDALQVEVARDRTLWKQDYARGKPPTQTDQRRPDQQPPRHHRSASTPTPRSSAPLQFQPARLYRLCRSKAYLFRGVEIRWSCDPALLKPARDDTPAEAVLHFPGGLRDSLEADIGGAAARRCPTLGRRGRLARRADGHKAGRVEWAVRLARGGRRLPALLLQHRAHPAGRHPRGRLPRRPAEGAARLGRAARQQPPRRRRSSPRTSPAAWPPSSRCSSATRNSRARPRKNSPAPRPPAWPKRRCATASTISSPATRPPPTTCSPSSSSAPRNACAASELKDTPRKSATRRLRLPGKLTDCTRGKRRRHRNLPGRGRQRRRLRQAGAQPRHPGGAAAARQNPQRRQRLGRQAAAEPGTEGSDRGAGLRRRRPLRPRQAALRPRHHHDRRRRGRRPHRLAADDLLLPRAAGTGAPRPHLSGPAAAVPPDPGREIASTPWTTPTASASSSSSRPAPRSKSAASRASARCRRRR